MSRVYNFSAGPAVLPEPVLKEVAAEMMDYQGSGMSVMEMRIIDQLYATLLIIAILLIIYWLMPSPRLLQYGTLHPPEQVNI